MQDLHLEPLHQPYFYGGIILDTVFWTVCLGWLWTSILLISASWIAGIIGEIHGVQLLNLFFMSF
jgi:hypothetical protein